MVQHCFDVRYLAQIQRLRIIFSKDSATGLLQSTVLCNRSLKSLRMSVVYPTLSSLSNHMRASNSLSYRRGENVRWTGYDYEWFEDFNFSKFDFYVFVLII